MDREKPMFCCDHGLQLRETLSNVFNDLFVLLGIDPAYEFLEQRVGCLDALLKSVCNSSELLCVLGGDIRPRRVLHLHEITHELVGPLHDRIRLGEGVRKELPQGLSDTLTQSYPIVQGSYKLMR